MDHNNADNGSPTVPASRLWPPSEINQIHGMFDLHFIKDLGGKLIGRHFVFRGQAAEFQTRLRLCRAFALLCHSNPPLFFFFALGFSLAALSGTGNESARSDVFLAAAFLLLMRALFHCVCYVRLRFARFVEIDTFPKLRARLSLRRAISSYQMIEKKINCISWHFSIMPSPVSHYAWWIDIYRMHVPMHLCKYFFPECIHK